MPKESAEWVCFPTSLLKTEMAVLLLLAAAAGAIGVCLGQPLIVAFIVVGILVGPSFAVGRSQEIIFHLGKLCQKGNLRHLAVYLDSAMANAVTETYHRYQNVFNCEDGVSL